MMLASRSALFTIILAGASALPTSIDKKTIRAMAGGYCATTSPEVNPCCQLNDPHGQDQCVHFCEHPHCLLPDGCSHKTEPCCSEPGLDAQARCRSNKGVIPHIRGYGHGSHDGPEDHSS